MAEILSSMVVSAALPQVHAVAYGEKFIERCAVRATWESISKLSREIAVERARYWLYHPEIEAEEEQDKVFRASVLATAGLTGKPEEKSDAR